MERYSIWSSIVKWQRFNINSSGQLNNVSDYNDTDLTN